jgi:tetratricopeptide (TPR) repeat protein
MKRTVRILLCICTLALPFDSLAQGKPGATAEQHDHGAMPPDQIGSASVHFETSCAPAVKDDFNKAVALLHSFWFPEAIKMFNSILEKDPNCAMAHWGIAASLWGNPFAGLKNAKVVEITKASIDKAKATGSPTPRERAYIDAQATLVTSTDPTTHAARIAAYDAAMAKLAADYPADTEGRIFYALAVCQAAVPTDKTYAKNIQAAGILEPLFAKMPTHPGLAHYIIHAYDVPPLAPKALDAARKYASLAPAIPHALHMPSHTFTRVGSWKESIDTNRRSAEAARKSNGAGEELHALDYQTYAYLQIAQDQAAKATVDHALSVVGAAEGAAAGAAGAGAYAVAAIPARYVLERGAWADAAALTPRSSNTPYTEGITLFARALGAARSGNPGAATADIEGLAALRDKMQAMKDPYWTEIVDIQRRVALAWQTYAQGNKDEGLKQMAAAADAEDKTDKSAVSPGPLAPARELYGEMLLDAGRAKDALAAFEATMKKEPNRFRGLYGGARAAEAAGDKAKAREYYKKLLDVAKDADTERPELARAKKFVGN